MSTTSSMECGSSAAAFESGGSPPQSKAKPVTPRELQAIHAQWHKIDAGRADERDSRTARLDFISRVAMRPVPSTKDLTSDEALKVIEAMRAETGETFRPVGHGGKRRKRIKNSQLRITDAELTRIGQMAGELFGERWEEMLHHRARERFGARSLRDLSGSQGRQLVEELLQRLAVAEIKRLRAKFPQQGDDPDEHISRAEIEAQKAQQRHRFFVGVPLVGTQDGGQQ